MKASVVRADAPAGGEKIIVIEGLSKWYGEFQALKEVYASVNKGEVVVVIGPSGSGKSTLIRCINRLEKYQQGRIVVDGIEPDDQKIDQIRRETGMVFQSFNLFPHLTVLENVTLAPIRVRKWPRSQAGAGHVLSHQGRHPGAGQKVSGAALGWAAAARSDCSSADHGA